MGAFTTHVAPCSLHEAPLMFTRLLLLGLLAIFGAAAGCSSDDDQDRRSKPDLAKSREAIALPLGFVDEAIGGSWIQATGVTFSPDGRTFVWEKAGRVFEVNADGTRRPTPLIDIQEEVGDWRDHGLLGVAFHPNFASNGYVYLSYVVDYHHLKHFGTPEYSPSENQYLWDTIGRVTRYTARSSDNFTSVDPGSRFVIFGDSMSTGCPILHESHGVGALGFAQDGTLLVSCGDSASFLGADGGGATKSDTAVADGIIRPEENVGAFRSQLVNSSNGKILRLNPTTGEGVPSNPFFDPALPRSPRSRVWSFGLRNPSRFSVRPETGSHDSADGQPGSIYIGDVGWAMNEELDVARGPGQNFGWPLYEGLEPQGFYQGLSVTNKEAPNPLFGTTPPNRPLCTQQFFPFGDLLAQDTLNAPSFPNDCDPSVQVPSSIQVFEHTRPVLAWNHTSSASVPTYDASGLATTALLGSPGVPGGTQFYGACSIGGAWYTGGDYPETYRDTYFHADFVGGWIKNLRFDDQDRLIEVRNFAPMNQAAVVSMATNPLTGDLYYVDYEDRVRRIRYSGADGRPPSAVAMADVEFGPSPLSVQFTGDQSRDPELGPLTYSWDFGDGSPASSAPNPVHVFDAGDGLPHAYEVVLRVTDIDGLTSTAELTIVVNDTPPRVTILSPVNGGVFSIAGPSVIPLEAAVSDDEQAIGSLTCSWRTILHHNSHVHAEPSVDGCVQTADVSPVACDEESYFFEFSTVVSDGEGLTASATAILYPDCTPTIVSPQFTTGKNPTFSWIRVLGADKFQVVVDDSSGPGVIDVELTASVLGCADGPLHCVGAGLGTLAVGSASVKVRAHNPVDGWRAWSEPRAFFVRSCGDGIVDQGEDCDDGNSVNDDTCSNECITATCSDGAPNQGETGIDCGGPCAACVECGDGVVEGTEQCDDGNPVNNDTCSNACVAATCSDGVQNQGETGTDCGGPCVACSATCMVNWLTTIEATASSIETATTPASAAIDGSMATRWSSGFSDPQWLYVDLGTQRRIKRVQLRWENAASWSYDIQVADSASGPWATIYADNAGNGGTDDITNLNANGRYVRMYSRSRTSQWGNSIWEFEVYGDLSPTCGAPVTCGNGALDSGEECDDGNTVNDDVCSNACVQARCTDGVRNQGETATDCGGPCSACVVCGDGVVEGTEQCDDGNAVNNDTCSNACVTATCSDGVRNQGEMGTDCGGPCSACVACGDGVVTGTEQCDDGNAVNNDTCSNACVTATCSDGLQNQGETGTDCGGPCVACATVCTVNRLTTTGATASSIEAATTPAAAAIDGSMVTRWSSEFSDPQWLYVDLGTQRRIKRVLLRWENAASSSYDVQVADSASGPWSTIATDEAANGGTDDITNLNANGRYVRMYSRSRTTQWGNSIWEFEVYGDLSPTCGAPVTCGNGTLDSGEECDDGNTVNDDVCSNACVQARCTDGVRNQGETGTDCGGPCSACVVCGDGVVEGTEQCDDGNAVNNDTCSNACVTATCSDGARNQGEAGIDCGGPCSACVVCGDGVVTGTEQCDDGNAVNNDTCSNACVAATCSDGVQNQGETGPDCGGPCVACATVCMVNRLTTTGATASSIEAATTPAAAAIDGSMATRWSSGFSDPQWLYVDLGTQRRIKRVVLRWENAASSSYDVQVADSASGPWATIAADEAANGGTDDITNLNANGRYVRMYSRSRTTQWGNSIWEFEVYGDLSPTCGAPVTCGNGALDSGEECDDGNTVNDDVCSNACVQARCTDGVRNQGETGTDCGGPCSACVVCGDGVVEGAEQCDDGNAVNNDTCSNACITATCSDGVQNQGETGIDCGGPCVACSAICMVDRLTTAGATASSIETGTTPASAAIDGSMATRWSSGFSDPQWLYVDLGDQRRIKRVVLRWEAAASSSYDIQVADSASGPWSTIATDNAGNGGNDDITNLNANGRYVRMYSRARTTQWGNSIWEFEVYGDLGTTCQQ
jgi:cysteine-rich repeat protein